MAEHLDQNEQQDTGQPPANDNGVVIGHAKHKKNLKPLIIVAIVAVLLLAIGVFAVVSRNGSKQNDQSQNVTRKTVCSNEIITEAGPLITEGSGSQLTAVAKKVMALPEFDRDPNCLYIVVNSYVNVSDAANGRKYYDKLKVVYDPQAGYSRSFGDTLITPEGLKKNIEYLEAQAKRLKENGVYADMEEQ